MKGMAHTRRCVPGLSRRDFLLRTSSAAAGLILGSRLGFASPQARFARDPFSLGVASGYPRPDGFVLWTRLAPDPLEGGGMLLKLVRVSWEVASDEKLTRVVQRGTAIASPDYAHAVHVELQGLEPDRPYWYRFRTGDSSSCVGRTRTAPAPGSAVDRIRFAFASCQQYEQGFFTAYRHMVSEELDVVIHLGDYIYESSWGIDHVRKHGAPEPITLEDYRARFALYRSDPDLQAAHAAFPWIVTWDDHEVDNDYANERSQDLDPPEWFLARRAAAYRAYYEHMPLPRSAHPFGPHMRLHTRVAFGSLLDFYVLDDRQYRSHHVCPNPGKGGAAIVEECPQRLDPSRTLLGSVQEEWLFGSLGQARARWNVLAQQTRMAQRPLPRDSRRAFWTDGWDGYPIARRRLLEHIHASRTPNPLVIGGDIHSFWVSDLKPDFDDPGSPTVATEIVGTSITSQPPGRDEEVDAVKSKNPHIRFGNYSRRGYVTIEMTPSRARVRLRAMDNVTDSLAGISTLRSFVVAEGRPGAETD